MDFVKVKYEAVEKSNPFFERQWNEYEKIKKIGQ